MYFDFGRELWVVRCYLYFVYFTSFELETIVMNASVCGLMNFPGFTQASPEVWVFAAAPSQRF